MAFLRALANSVMNSPGLGGQSLNRPSDWANAPASIAGILAANPQLTVYFDPSNSNFAIYTRGQYNRLITYGACISDPDIPAETCLSQWLE